MNLASIEKLALVVDALSADRERLLRDAQQASDTARKAALRARAIVVTGQIGLINEVILDRLRERAADKHRDGREPETRTPPDAADAVDFATYLGRVRTFATEALTSPNATVVAIAELLLRMCRTLDMGLHRMSRDIRAAAELEMLIAAGRPPAEDAFGDVR